MVQLLHLSRRTLPSPLSLIKTLNSQHGSPPHLRNSPRRPISSVAESRSSAIQERLLRLLHSEIGYETRLHPPREPAKELNSFVVEGRPGEQWVRLSRKHGVEERITVDATMFDAFVTTGSGTKDSDLGDYGKLRMSLVVDIEKGEGRDGVLQFLCSAWPDSLVVKRVFFHRHSSFSTAPYMGPKFRKMDERLQGVLLEYLRERAIDDDFATLLHEYMKNKDKSELVLWMENVKSFIKRFGFATLSFDQ